DRLEGRPAPLTIPIGSGSPKDSPTPFTGIIDLIELQALYFEARDDGKTIRRAAIPAELASLVQTWRERLFDILTEHDDKDLVTSVYLEGKEVPPAALRQLVREQTLKRLIQPV